MVSGVERVRFRLKALIPEMEEQVGEAMMAAADRVVASAKLLVPKDTGHLASTIRRGKPHKSKRGNLVVSISAGDDTTRVGKGRQFQLARLIEFGTTARPAQPYFFPAYRTNKAAAKAAIRKAIRTTLRAK